METHSLNYPMESNSHEKKTLKLPIKHAHTEMDVPSQLQTHCTASSLLRILQNSLDSDPKLSESSCTWIEVFYQNVVQKTLYIEYR